MAITRPGCQARRPCRRAVMGPAFEETTTMRLWYSEPFRLWSVTDERGRRQLTDEKKARALARDAAHATGKKPADILRPSRAWYVFEYTSRHPKGRRRSTGRETKYEAQEWVKARLRSGAPTTKARGQVTFSEAVDEWLEELRLRRRSERTLAGYRSQSNIWRRFFADARVAEIERDDVLEFFRHRERGELRKETSDAELSRRKPRHPAPGHKPSARTLNLDRIVLRSFFRWARKRGYCEGSPLQDIDPWREVRPDPRILTQEEVTRLLDACRRPYRGVVTRKGREPEREVREYHPPPHLYPIVLTALTTLLRLGNVLNLRWEQVDFRAGTITIDAAEAKGRRDIVVPMSPGLKECLAGLPRGRPRDRVFGDVRHIRKPFMNAVKRAGIEGRVTFHTLRKTGADHLRRRGVALEVAQRFGAWANIGVMLGYYRNPARGELEAAAQVLDELADEERAEPRTQAAGTSAS